MLNPTLTIESQLSYDNYTLEINKLKASPAGSHRLTFESFELLIDDLTRYENKVGNNQSLALYELVSEMTAFALGLTNGRKAYSLPTSCGKTTAIIAWASTVHKLGLSE